MKFIKCKLGLHKWGKARSHYISGSNVKDFQQKCSKCGKVKKWTEPVKDTDECC